MDIVFGKEHANLDLGLKFDNQPVGKAPSIKISVVYLGYGPHVTTEWVKTIFKPGNKAYT
ncbi:hypothetical protein IscW_ISCW021281 [Ixodes scapularis]|uniref:Uncharacterized protein n=1 Tax=Ixodes scapularis TaxID=6945 RepID=B7Q673_IXOSC|nr:hypothetical protein IscW_ISCW021281 [Ixodes scapularis]|eukprot:XP_002402833.1 hypothetical protein IscW_ISCW021281 [Ixodes scapularis]